MTHADLIARLEALTGPDQEVADEVLLACGWSMIEFGALDNPSYEWLAPDESTTYVGGDHPNPLASLDAALTLRPDDQWEWELSWNSYGATAKLGDPRLYLEGEHKIPAIALCVAALKARAQEEGK